MVNLRKSRAVALFVSAACVILFAFIMLLTCIEISAFDIGFYSIEYEKLKRPEAIGISQKELMGVTQALLAYIKGQRPDLNIKAVINGHERYVFNEREMAHMVDVRDLFIRGYILRNILIAMLVVLVFVLYVLTRKDMTRWLFKAYLFFLAFLAVVCGILVVLISQDFTSYWNYFHYIFFDNDLWLLDPETDILIQMVPEQFFYDIVVRIVTHFILGMLITGLLLGSAFLLINRVKRGGG
ncbi:integral membrane protein (TIGR01906 family) [Caldicoprobacter guelmensis]|uniref:TIGR01906 family membrane protein n=1 Tax=Caldicoprobacter guelmensis TaxID=1170224 RepID=UPI00195871D4|nr:TIGR01906 family membrane protein [Caldicoprobacter guelmensis]MBM7583097.1 integral membrane protein (TIGR01906 family) [Caldicoprobacter guelmensis]